MSCIAPAGVVWSRKGQKTPGGGRPFHPQTKMTPDSNAPARVPADGAFSQGNSPASALRETLLTVDGAGKAAKAAALAHAFAWLSDRVRVALHDASHAWGQRTGIPGYRYLECAPKSEINAVIARVFEEAAK